MPYKWREKQAQEEQDRIKKRLMAYGTYVLLKWYANYVRNAYNDKQYNYRGVPMRFHG